MPQFWNERYAIEEYVYGKEPNKFFKEQLKGMAPGKILLPAEGEGRNAVFAAQLGFDVYAFDASEKAREKANKLAEEFGVFLQYDVTDYGSMAYPANEFDVIALIFAHMHPAYRQTWHRKFLNFLKPGGKLILEGFAKEQITYGTGGPQNIHMLFSEDELRDDFSGLDHLSLLKKVIHLNEGIYHQGEASVIRMTGIK